MFFAKQTKDGARFLKLHIFLQSFELIGILKFFNILFRILASVGL